MRNWKLITMILAMAVGLTGSTWAQENAWRAQSDRDGYGRVQTDRDHDRDRKNDRRNDRDRDDRRNDRDRDDRVRNNRDRDDGYYGQYRNGRRGDGDRDDVYRNHRNGNYGVYGNNGRYGYRNGDLAYQTGYRDGSIDGQNDSRSGRSYRATNNGNYKHADRGYNTSWGDKGSYQQSYRQGYLQGYQAVFRRY